MYRARSKLLPLTVFDASAVTQNGFRVFRGITEDVSSHYAIGEVVEWPGITSTTLSAGVAGAFMSLGQGTLFCIHTISGIRVEQFSFFPVESEVLLFPTKLTVLGKRVQEGNGGEHVVIELEEIVGPWMHDNWLTHQRSSVEEADLG